MLRLDALEGSNHPQRQRLIREVAEAAMKYLNWLSSEPGAMNDDGYAAMRVEALEALEEDLRDTGVLYDMSDVNIGKKKEREHQRRRKEHGLPE